MAVKYGKKRNKRSVLAYTICAVVLLCLVFISMMQYLYDATETQAYEQLHIQTKQIKDDLTLQLLSDRENLQTMASFAAKLYGDGEGYELLLESFKPIGLIANIGILNPDNTFVTKAGSLDLTGKISFDEEAKRGAYISGRVKDLTRDDYEIVRSAVPIKHKEQIVGVLYGVVNLDGLDGKYKEMADSLNAQLFVFEKETGDVVIDTVQKGLKNISRFKTREFTEGNSYEKMIRSERGYTSFISSYSGERLHIHYSPIDELGWTIFLARPESQVFAQMNAISGAFALAIILMAAIIVIYLGFLMKKEKNEGKVARYSSNIRKLLLEINQQQDNIGLSLKEISAFSDAKYAVFFDTDGEEHSYPHSQVADPSLSEGGRTYFVAEILRYAAELHRVNSATFNLMSIVPNSHLAKTNPQFYEFMKKNKFSEFTFTSLIDKSNHVCILGVVNPRRSSQTRVLLEDISFCFSIAIYNKKHLSKTELAATTDSLTGVANRVSYNNDIPEFDKEAPEMFSCIYIDVNELHMRNNRYGHSAGDEMLLYIANSLKEIFYGHNVYRMGGDEFLVFTRGLSPEQVKKSIGLFIEQLEIKGYHVAIGWSYRARNTNSEDMVREAELRMYDAKSEYYQKKEIKSVSRQDDDGYVQLKTNIAEIDVLISMLKEHYNGIYRVSLDSDKAKRILMPKYLGYSENEDHFSDLMKRYVHENINPEYHRAVTNFMNYDSMKRQLSEGRIPQIKYKKANGEGMLLSVYPLDEAMEAPHNTLWVFSKN